MIAKEHIVEFIAYLYKRRYNENAPAQLLQKWSALNETEIDDNLKQLFASWQYTPAMIDNELHTFNQGRNIYYHEYETTITPSTKRKIPWVFIFFIALLCFTAFIGYKYIHFSKLKYIYCLTDNVSIRDAQGNKLGRMDLFVSENDVVKSYDKLIYIGEEKNYKFPDLKNPIAVQEVMLTNSFIDFILHKNNTTGYVASAYLTKSAEEFKLFKSVFVDLKKNQIENNRLSFNFRRTIVGCLRISDKKNMAVELPCNGSYDKEFNGIVTVDLGDGKYQVIARMDNKKYYSFIGNPSKSEYAEIKALPINYLGMYETDLKGNYLLKKEGAQYVLYECDAKKTAYTSESSASNKEVLNFNYSIFDLF